MATAATAPDPLAMTDAEVDAIVTDARQTADDASRALAAAEADPTSVTPAELAELRANAAHTDLLVPVARRRHAEVVQARTEARRAETLARIRSDAADDLDHADEIVAALATFEAAAKNLCDLVHNHNERISYWAGQMSQAGIPPVGGDGTGADAISHQVIPTFAEYPGGVTLGHKVFRPMRGARLIGATIYRLFQKYPADFARYGVHMPLIDGDLTEGGVPVDLRARIRRDA